MGVKRGGQLSVRPLSDADQSRAAHFDQLRRRHRTGHNTLENEVILRRYEKAIEWLLRIAKGLADLPGQDAGGESGDGTDGVGITPGARDWT